jgi:predicted transcriptional regulator
MTTAREITHMGAACIWENDTLAAAAQKMRDLGVGSLPICGEDDRLHGILTDRDIVVTCIAEGRDPSQVRAADLAQGTLFWVDAAADLGEVLRQMEEHRTKRQPVIENHRVVGMISEADPGPKPLRAPARGVRPEGVRRALREDDIRTGGPTSAVGRSLNVVISSGPRERRGAPSSPEPCAEATGPATPADGADVPGRCTRGRWLPLDGLSSPVKAHARRGDLGRAASDMAGRRWRTRDTG